METEYIPDKITYHPEEEICRLLAADDWRGMELMFRVYYKRLVVWADTFLEDMQLAEDIVQELFITLWEKKRRRTLQSSTLSSFLFVSVRNQCYHRLEKKDTLRHTVDLKEVNIAFEEYNEKHDYIITRILNEIEKLPPRSQEIMLAVFVDGLKYREVAEKYHISLSTVKTLLGNAVCKLKEQLGTDDLTVFLFLFRIKK
jgi:RNA polymerase sigma factor, sigma-70 family